jgi:hypothetical protein
MNAELREVIEAVKEQMDEAQCPLCDAYMDERGHVEHLEECPLGQLFAYLSEGTQDE